jgi:hypothetical protein
VAIYRKVNTFAALLEQGLISHPAQTRMELVQHTRLITGISAAKLLPHMMSLLIISATGIRKPGDGKVAEISL